MNTMKALVKVRSEPGLELLTVPIPQIVSPNEVKIRIKKAAICGTDSHIWQWDDWAQTNVVVPGIIGHEYVGEIVEIGSAVSQFAIGQRVSGEGHIACGYCRNCLTGNAHVCAKTIGVGVSRDGAFAEYIVIPEGNARAIPDGIPDDVVAILDPLGNAVHAALAYDLVGEDVLITGAGPIGCMAAAVARKVGARHVVITDQRQDRLELALEMGATKGVLVEDWDKKRVLSEIGSQEGFGVGLEMSGASAALSMLVDAMNAGGKVSLLGLFPESPVVDLNDIILKGIQLQGVYGRRMYDTWHKMLALLESGLDVSRVISNEYPMENYRAAFESLIAGKGAKVLLRVG